jgi:hypothetical protein
MQKQYLRVLLAAICFVDLGVTANAETRGQIVVTLPFEFVVSGKTLPAGTYTVSRFSDDKSEGVILSSRENRVSVFVHPIEVASARMDKPSVSFERVGESHFLSKIETEHDIYTIPVSRALVLEARGKQTDGTSASRSSGDN